MRKGGRRGTGPNLADQKLSEWRELLLFHLSNRAGEPPGEPGDFSGPQTYEKGLLKGSRDLSGGRGVREHLESI